MCLVFATKLWFTQSMDHTALRSIGLR